MKVHLNLQLGSETSEHRLVIRARDGDHAPLEFKLDGEAMSADCVQVAPGVYSVLMGGRSYEARIAAAGAPGPGGRRVVTIGSHHFSVEVLDPRRRRSSGSLADHSGPQEILAPMPGKIVRILAASGQEISQGAGLLVIEAMKMQNELRAPRAGRVAAIHVTEGDGVESGAPLIRLE
jgi:biotin carboxyl carrier protein